MKYKIGDKVRILSKTVFGYETMHKMLEKGCIGYIVKNNLKECYYRTPPDADYEVWYDKNRNKNSSGDWYRESDLELAETKEENMKESKFKKGNHNLVIKSLFVQRESTYYGYNPSITENTNFIRRMITEFGYQYGEVVTIDDKFLNYIEQHPCFVKWLLENGFIEEVDAFKPFTVEIRIDSPEKFWDLYERIDINHGGTFDSYMDKGIIKNSSPSWKEVNSYKDLRSQ